MSTSVEPSSPDVRSGRKWTLPLMVLGLVMAFVVISIFSYRQSGRSAVQDLEAKIRMSGDPLTLDDLAAAYPPVPDASNGATLLLRLWEETDPAHWGAFREGKPQLPARAPSRIADAVPFLSPDAQHIARTGELPATNRVAAEAYLEENKDHLEAVRAALRYPQFRFPIQITNGFNALLPHLAAMKTEAQNFRIEALLACERGDGDAAIGALEAAARVGKVLAGEPVMISQLVRLSCNNMVVEDLQRLLSRQSLATGQLARVESLLDQLRMPGVLHDALVAQRAGDLSVFSLPRAMWLGPEQVDGASKVGFSAAMGVFDVLGLKDADRRLMLETMAEAIALADRDDPAALMRYETLFREAGERASEFPPKFFSSMLLPAMENVPRRFATFEARRRAAKVALAVERYRMMHDGLLPQKLDELVPRFLSEIPKDPIDGKPLRFARLPVGFVVYSIGANHVDDGGKERPRKGSAKDFDETFFIER